MKYVYIVVVQAEYAMPRVSGEAYTSLAGAQRFVESRVDMPEKLNSFHYRGRQNDYFINALSVR